MGTRSKRGFNLGEEDSHLSSDGVRTTRMSVESAKHETIVSPLDSPRAPFDTPSDFRRVTWLVWDGPVEERISNPDRDGISVLRLGRREEH